METKEMETTGMAMGMGMTTGMAMVNNGPKPWHALNRKSGKGAKVKITQILVFGGEKKTAN